jgi:orotate phosphoribosyltransferase-like protein
MSKIKELVYDIQEMYIDGMSAKGIANVLEVPIDQVLAVLESFGVADQPQEEFDPWNTVNS